jgi:hypothetical protein
VRVSLDLAPRCSTVDASLAVLRASLPAETFCRLHAAAVRDAQLGCLLPAAEWAALCATLLGWLRGGRLAQLHHTGADHEPERLEPRELPGAASSPLEAPARWSGEPMRNCEWVKADCGVPTNGSP